MERVERPRRAERVASGYAGRMLAVVAAGSMATTASRLLLPPLLPSLIADLGITPARAGLALSVLWGMVALAQFPGGRLSDRLSRKTVLVGSLVLVSCGLATLAATYSFVTLLVGVAVLGVGAGLYQPAAFAQLSELYVERRGRAFGVNAASFDLGGALAALVAATVLAVATWRTSFVVVLVGVVAVVTLIHWLTDQRYVIGSVNLDLRRTLTRLASGGRVRTIVFAFALFNFASQGMINFLPTILHTTKGFSTEFAATLFAGLFLVGVVVKPLAGTLGDRFGQPLVAIGMPLVCAAGLVTVHAGRSQPVVVLGVFVFAVGLAAYFPLMSTFLMNTLHGSNKGGDFGAARTIFMGLGSLGPAYVGAVADSIDYATAIVGFIPCFLASAVLTAWLARGS